MINKFLLVIPKNLLSFESQSTFSMNEQQHLEAISDIRRIMERSSRFLSLSGLSGVSAGVAALAGAAIARHLFFNYYRNWFHNGFSDVEFNLLRLQLIVLGCAVMFVAFSAGLYFTWRKAKRAQLPIWDATSRKVLINGLIPMLAGGAFIAGLLYNNLEIIVAPTCLVFYGLAIVNASKYTLTDIRYLGIAEIILGIVNMFYLRHGLLFWALGFGVLHIFYGVFMWWKYERTATQLN
jgi:hypothetical protein